MFPKRFFPPSQQLAASAARVQFHLQLQTLFRRNRPQTTSGAGNREKIRPNEICQLLNQKFHTREMRKMWFLWNFFFLFYFPTKSRVSCTQFSSTTSPTLPTNHNQFISLSYLYYHQDYHKSRKMWKIYTTGRSVGKYRQASSSSSSLFPGVSQPRGVLSFT